MPNLENDDDEAEDTDNEVKDFAKISSHNHQEGSKFNLRKFWKQ